MYFAPTKDMQRAISHPLLFRHQGHHITIFASAFNCNNTDLQTALPLNGDVRWARASQGDLNVLSTVETNHRIDNVKQHVRQAYTLDMEQLW